MSGFAGLDLFYKSYRFYLSSCAESQIGLIVVLTLIKLCCYRLVECCFPQSEQQIRKLKRFFGDHFSD